VAADGPVLGVLDRSSYNQPESKDEPASHESEKGRPIEEKESVLRQESPERSAATIPEEVKVTTVCDREGDMYELFSKSYLLKEPPFIRIARNRMTVENKRILDEIRKERCQGRVGARLPRDVRNGSRYCG
jgi:hypothetical protein